MGSLKEIIGVMALLFVAQATFGGAAVVYKVGLQSLRSPLAFLFYRQIVSGPLLMAIAYGIERQIPARKDLPWFVITGVVGVFLNQALYIFGVAYAGASIASIMQLLAAPITSLLSILFKLEKFSKFKLVGLSMSVLGAACLVVPSGWISAIGESPSPSPSSSIEAPLAAPYSLLGPVETPVEEKGHSPTLGIALLTCQAVFGSIQIILQKNYIPQSYGPITVAGSVTLVAAPFTAALSALVLRGDEWVIEGAGIWAICYAIFVVALFGFTLWTWAVKRTDGSLVAASATMNPLCGVLLATIFLGEHIHLKEVIGGLLILCGFVVVSYQKWKEMQQEQPQFQITLADLKIDENATPTSSSEAIAVAPGAEGEDKASMMANNSYDAPNGTSMQEVALASISEKEEDDDDADSMR